MNRPPRNHHFVPASLLRYFSIDGLEKRIQVFDKWTGRTFAPAIENAGSENDFNKLKLPQGDLNFEPLFNEIDAALFRRLKEIHASRSVASLTNQARSDWADIIAVQMLRTPLTRSVQVQTATDIAASLVEAGVADFTDFEMPSENDSRLASLKLLFERAPFWKALCEKDFVLFEPAGNARYWTSDYPVLLESTVPCGDRGLAAPGIGVYFPLGPDLMLGLLCNSVSVTLNARPIEQLKLDPSSAAPYIAMREGLRTGLPIRLPDNLVIGFNLRQAANCSRFVYMQSDMSSVITPFLERHPDLRDVRTHVRVGRMDEAPAANGNMPNGRWLVLFGARNHHMVQISEWDDDAFPLEVTIEDVDTMNRALADGAFSEMRLYENQSVRRMKRDVRIEILSPTQPARVAIRSSAPSMDALDELIENRARAKD